MRSFTGIAEVDTADRPFGLPSDPIVDAYYRHRSVWKAGAELGISGQAVHAALRRAGIVLRAPKFSDKQIARITEYYTKTAPSLFSLDALAAEIGKHKTSVCRVARRLGLTFPKREMSADRLAKNGRPHSDATRKKLKDLREGWWSVHPHPRGFAGKKHSSATRLAISRASKRSWATFKTFGTGCMSEENRARMSARMQLEAALRPAHKNYSRTKHGRRDDLGGLFFRSSWEANYARYLNLLLKMRIVESWQYEPETFWFDGIRRGTASYRPDFRVLYRGDCMPEYVEIKGWIVAKDHTKWKRMAKYHPSVKLIIVKAKEYYEIERKWSAAIPEWERQRQGRGR